MPRNPERLASLPTWALDAIRERLHKRTYNAMAELGGGSFGYDWPTAAVYYPRLVRSYRRVSAELKRRVPTRA